MAAVDDLRYDLFLEDVSQRLSRGDSPRKVARDLNQRSDQLQDLIKSDEFLVVLERFDGALADDIRAEREAAKPEEYETLILKEATKSIQKLAELRESADNEQARVAASRALVELAQKLKKESGDKSTRRITMPASQIEGLKTAASELKEMANKIAEQSS